MATRMYLSSTANSTPITPAVDSSWTGTYSSFARYDLTTTASSSFSTLTGTQSFASTGTYCIAQFISPPVASPAAQADWDTVTGSILCRWSESSGTANYIYKYLWRLYGDDGSNVWRSWFTGGTEFNIGAGTTNSNMVSRKLILGDFWGAGTPTVAFGSLRMILEIGVARSSGSAASFNAYCEIGGNSGTDLANDETGTSQFNPWFEISNSITFTAESTGGVNNQLMMMGVGI